MNIYPHSLLASFAGLLFFAALAYPSIADDSVANVVEVKIENRQVVVPETGSIKINEDDVIEVHWTSDEPVELHIHGYDLHVQVQPGKTATSVIEAHASGRFPITSHGWGHGGHGGHGHDALAYLEVYPR